MYKNICFGKIRFPRGVIGEDGKQFVKGVSPCFLYLIAIRSHDASFLAA